MINIELSIQEDTLSLNTGAIAQLIQKEDQGYLFFEMINMSEIEFVNLVINNLIDMLSDIEKDYKKYLILHKYSDIILFC